MVSYSAGKNGLLKLRSDCRAAVMMKNRSYHESGEQVEEPIHPGQQRRIQQGHTGWEYWLSSPSSSWYASEWSWK